MVSSLTGYFLLFYPICMVVVWMVGGLIFRLRWENKNVAGDGIYPFVTIVVPAHDEEDCIQETLDNMRHLEYPYYEVIVVDDGSTDRTGRIIDRMAAQNSQWLRAMHQSPNKGKAMALNKAVAKANGEIIVVVDADSLLEKDALIYLVSHFVASENVGAVTGSPRVRNRTTLLGKIQVGEYSYIIGLIKRAQRVYGRILTVSGAVVAYRRTAVFDVGLFDPAAVTEDIEITWKMHTRSWDVRYEPRALCWVLVPETIRGLWRQRVRWAQGGIEVLKKHYRVMFQARHRRLWPIYMEYVLSTVWAHVLIFSCLYMVCSTGADIVRSVAQAPSAAEGLKVAFAALVPSSPDTAATRTVLAMLCMWQFLVSLIIDFRYEKHTSRLKIYFWIVWYPAAYWLIQSLACITAVYKLITRRSRICAAWQSPDRGIHTLTGNKRAEAAWRRFRHAQ